MNLILLAFLLGLLIGMLFGIWTLWTSITSSGYIIRDANDGKNNWIVEKKEHAK